VPSGGLRIGPADPARPAGQHDNSGEVWMVVHQSPTRAGDNPLGAHQERRRAMVADAETDQMRRQFLEGIRAAASAPSHEGVAREIEAERPERRSADVSFCRAAESCRGLRSRGRSRARLPLVEFVEKVAEDAAQAPPAGIVADARDGVALVAAQGDCLRGMA
jgi:hypothetical protein